ncbi:MAG: trigger factor [Gammaproteobacteria bacterium]|nr:trigger factor [Gammaproteobacteria bacterium]
MTAILEESTGIKRVLRVTVPQSEIDKGVKEQLNVVAQRANLPGFRPGKAPRQVIEKQFSDSIRNDVISKAIEQAYSNAIVEHQLKPAGMPKINVDEASIKKDLSFKIELEVFPEFEVKGLPEIEIIRTTAKIDQASKKTMMENLQKQHINWGVIDREAKNEDRLVIDFKGFKGEEAFKGGDAKDFKLILGTKMMIPGFEDALIGKKKGDEFDMDISFPKDYHVEELAGQPVVFKVKVKKVEAPALPELNDEFAKLFQIESLKLLEDEVNMNMERELEFALKNKLKTQVIDGLLKHNEIELPSALVDEEAQRLAEAAIAKMKSWGQQNVGTPPLSLFTDEAKKRVALGLIMSQIITQYDLKVDQDMVSETIQKMASVYESPEEVVKMFRQNKARLSEIEQVTLEEQVVNKVIEMAKIVEEEKTFEDVMQHANAEANILPQA